jgi:hypothetical protein
LVFNAFNNENKLVNVVLKFKVNGNQYLNTFSKNQRISYQNGVKLFYFKYYPDSVYTFNPLDLKHALFRRLEHKIENQDDANYGDLITKLIASIANSDCQEKLVYFYKEHSEKKKFEPSEKIIYNRSSLYENPLGVMYISKRVSQSGSTSKSYLTIFDAHKNSNFDYSEFKYEYIDQKFGDQDSSYVMLTFKLNNKQRYVRYWLHLTKTCVTKLFIKKKKASVKKPK